MRVLRVAPLCAVVLSLVVSACSKPDTAKLAVRSAPRPAPHAAVAPVTMSGADKLRRLDIMLMVTALRCRTTRSDFTADYQRFSARQLASLNEGAARLRGELQAHHGVKGGQAAFDRLSTRIANTYGAGHPWLGCGQLKQVARNLAEVSGRPTLEEAAGQLLAGQRPSQLAYGRR